MNYQWYPGHMAKARRQMEADIKLIDLIIELTDARIPQSGRNPDIDEIGRNKSRMILLNKADLADPSQNEAWIARYRSMGMEALALDARKRSAMKQIEASVRIACREKIERDQRRGIKNRPIRAMVAGIPNVGKSTFINSFSGKAVTKTGNKPGVTKGKQWIRMSKTLELLDTPGILWPKFEDKTVGRNLAMIGSMNDDVLNLDELSLELISYLRRYYPGALSARYGVEEDTAVEPVRVLEAIAQARSCIKKGAEIDYTKAATLLLDEFRAGLLGRITLERPGEKEEPESIHEKISK